MTGQDLAHVSRISSGWHCVKVFIPIDRVGGMDNGFSAAGRIPRSVVAETAWRFLLVEEME